MLDLMPQWLRDGLGDDVLFWLGYLTNGKHLAWYASVQFTLFAAVAGALVALVMGLLGATLRNSRFLPLRLLGMAYTNMVRGIPDVLFFIFFPLAFEQGVEWVLSRTLCSAEEIATATLWPPCPAANLHFNTFEYLLLASVSLGIVYGALPPTSFSAPCIRCRPARSRQRAPSACQKPRSTGASASGRCGSTPCPASPTSGCC